MKFATTLLAVVVAAAANTETALVEEPNKLPQAVFKPQEKGGALSPQFTQKAGSPVRYGEEEKLSKEIPLHVEQMVGYEAQPCQESDKGFVIIA